MSAFGFFPFLPPPDEETRKKFEEIRDKQQMENEVFHHDVRRFFEELSQENLLTFHKLLQFIGHQGETAALTAIYLEGVSAGILQIRWNICPDCGKNHDEIPFEAPVTPQDEA